MTQQPFVPKLTTSLEGADVAERTDKLAADRKRLATLIGRLLARHWLRHPSEDSEGAQRDGSSNLERP